MSQKQHPSDPQATILGTDTASVPLPSYNTSLIVEVTYWLTSENKYDIQMSVTELSFNGDDDGVDNTSLKEMIDVVAPDAVERAVANGYPACENTAFVQPVRFWVESCGLRAGSGIATTFSVPSGTEWMYRAFSVECNGAGETTILALSYSGGDCSGSESTWEE